MSGRTLANWRRWLPPVIAAVLVIMLGAALTRPDRSGKAGSPLLDKPTLRSLDGVEVRLISQKCTTPAPRARNGIPQSTRFSPCFGGFSRTARP